ncbi:sodium:solute symporter [Siminovitchia sediminis]|uniref:Sodium:solute symporter n=1 Tax=Siminovitchia sediminis TaxID=1274353 RepID=A0ABW4KKC7_9BACI
MVVAIGTGVILLGIFLTKKISQFKVLTISELLEKRYSKETRLVSAIVATIYTLMLTVVQMIGIGSLLNVWLGWNMALCIIIGGGIVFLYTTMGGMWSVTMTDIVQFVIMTIGVFFLLLPMSLSDAGGWTALNTELPSGFFDIGHIGGERIFQYFILFTLGLMVGQDIWQRLFTAKTPKVSKIGTVAAGIYAYAYAIALAIIGMSAFVLLPNIEDTQNVFAEVAMISLPPGVLGLVLASVAAAIMSTASGSIIACSTLISNDIVKRFFKPDISDRGFVRISRFTTVGIGVFSIICAIWIQDILVALDVAYAVLSGALFFPVIFGLFSKKVHARAAFYSIILSAAVILAGLAILGITATEPIIYGSAVSFVTLLVLSFFTSNKEKDQKEINVS